MALLVFVTICVLFACQNNTSATQEGEALAKQYCASCHQYPEPSLLDKNSWEQHVLPHMGHMLGIYEDENKRASLIENENTASVFPEQPLIEKVDWEKIKSFYISQAPDKLNVPKVEITEDLENFEVIKPAFTISPPSSTLVKFMKDKTIYVGDAMSKKLLQFDANLNLLKSGNVQEGAVHLEEFNNEYWITVMGSFSPTDNASGFLLNLPKTENKQALVVAEQLRRPVHASYGDLDNDGKIDIVVSEFAKWTGRLTMLRNNENYDFTQSVLLNQTGAIKTQLQDFNNDGLLDIMVLFAQGKEGITILYNEGSGIFSPKEVLTFPPSYGSSSFEILDIDGDKDFDIIYTAGDNADFGPVLRPYHGVYIFENDGKNNFKQKLFYHINGAYAAKAADYDLDGDLDLAVISFFPDYATSGKESFVYLKNNGEYKFTASTFANNTAGRWIVMDAADKDGDGDIDIILGALTFEVKPDNGLVNQWMEKGLPFVILENKTK